MEAAFGLITTWGMPGHHSNGLCSPHAGLSEPRLEATEEISSNRGAQEVDDACMSVVGTPFKCQVVHLISLCHLIETLLLLKPLMQGDNNVQLL